MLYGPLRPSVGCVLHGVSLLLLIQYCRGLNSPPIISYAAGQRCLLVTSAAEERKTPVVLLVGMAQTIATWESHFPGLSRNRDLLVYECLGQDSHAGRRDNAHKNADELTYQDVSLPVQAQRLHETIQEVFPNDDEVDLVGFSLGGRIAMAAAATASSVPPCSKMIRRMHLTGVGAGRSMQGEIAVEAWKDLLLHGDMRGFAWSALTSTYSSAFLHSNRDRVQLFVDFIIKSNTAEALYALVEHTYVTNEQDDWHTLQMAKRIASANNTNADEHCATVVKLVVGELDCMAPLAEAKRVQQELKCSTLKMFDNCGHAVPMEEPRAWRKDVLAFLDK